MKGIYQKPRVPMGASMFPAHVIGDRSTASVGMISRPSRRIHKYAKKRKRHFTAAEKELMGILNSLGNGVLRGKFHREWVFGRWILDFLFWKNRLGIEVDGGYHRSAKQRKRDVEKDRDCENASITILRLTNEEVFGNRNSLINKLRASYRKAKNRCRVSSCRKH